MKRWSHTLSIGVLMFIFWTAACSYPAQIASTPSETIIPTEQLLIPITETSTTSAPVIPITGENVVQMQCQFCVNSFAHAVFVFPDAAIFDVETSSPVTCLTAEVVNGKRVLVCNGTQSTSFNLKICSDATNCLLFPVALQPCPLTGTGTQVTTVTPVFLTAINTLLPIQPSRTPKPRAPIASQAPTQTVIAPTLATTAPPPASTSTSEPPPADTSTSAPPPPPPTQADTPGPTSAPVDGNKKPTHTPKP